MAEPGDWQAVDRELRAALARWHARLGELRRDPSAAALVGPSALSESPIPEQLRHEEMRAAAAEAASDPLAAALRPWLDALAVEHERYGDRLAIARAWAEPRPIPGRERPTSLRELRRELVAGAHAGQRQAAATDLARAARPLADLALPAFERRIELASRVAPETAPLAVAELGHESDTDRRAAVADLAEKLLARTDDAARALRSGASPETLHRMLARGADQGWPARLTVRWLNEVFAGTGIGAGVSIRPALPEVWGASSFALALASLGAQLLDAHRPATLPFALHRHPAGVRRHQRRALFASIAAEESFATRVLGLGHDRARDHRRELTAAMALSLRLDAWRVLTGAAAYRGLAAAREAYLDHGERVLGPGLSSSLAGVLPELRPGDGASLVGSLLAVDARLQLVERHDSDWFRTPRAIAELRHEDTLARDPGPLDPGLLDGSVELVGSELERALG